MANKCVGALPTCSSSSSLTDNKNVKAQQWCVGALPTCSSSLTENKSSTTKRGILFLNGTPPTKTLMESVDFDLDIYCTDGAYNYLVNFAEPDVLIGDFDSLDTNLKISKKIEVITYGAEKNFTDGFLAVKTMISRGITDIDIYGALGGRPDHEMSNYLLLALGYNCKTSVRFVTEDFYIYLTDKTITLSTQFGKTVSLVPFSDSVHILYTKGLKYSIDNLVMNKAQNLADDNYIMGVSNLATATTVEYAVSKGLALVYLQK